MEAVRILGGVVLPYVAVTVFLVGMTYRLYKWKTLPSPSMTLFPAPPTEAANTVNTIQEVVLFKSLFRGDRALWLLAWTFHAVLALILVGHLRVFTNVDALLMRLGLTEANIQAMSGGVGGAAGVVILASAVFLLVRRLALRRVREVTGFGDLFALLLIGAILVTGNFMRFGAEHFDLTAARSYFSGLASFTNVAGSIALQNNVFLVHMCLAFLLLMVIPFSKILHLGGIFFTHQLIRRH